MSGLVLSVFPGIGLLDRGFEAEGFCIVRGPDLIFGGDIVNFHPPADVFDGIIGGPPCQCFSRLRHLVEANGYQLAPNLIPEFERVVSEARPNWFLMENVPQAPDSNVAGYQVHSLILNNRWVGGAQNRLRKFCFGTRDGRRLLPDVALFEAQEWEPAVLAHGGALPVPVRLGGNGKVKKTAARNLGYQTRGYFRMACQLQGLPDGFDIPCFTVAAKIRAIGNGVPWWMAVAIARAVKRATELVNAAR